MKAKTPVCSTAAVLVASAFGLMPLALAQQPAASPITRIEQVATPTPSPSSQTASTDINNFKHPAGTRTAPWGKLGHVERRGNGLIQMILIPGEGFGWQVWESFMERNKKRYTMYAVSLPGYGGTAPPEMPAEMDPAKAIWSDNAVKSLADFIRKQKLKRPVIVAHHQISDVYAVRLAVEHPNLVGGVVILNGQLMWMAGPQGQAPWRSNISVETAIEWSA